MNNEKPCQLCAEYMCHSRNFDGEYICDECCEICLENDHEFWSQEAENRVGGVA